MKPAKENWIEGQCRYINIMPKQDPHQKAYQLVKDLIRESAIIQDKAGECLTKEQAILDRRTEYLVLRALQS